MIAPRHGSPVAETELGIERQCNSCGEWWPLDDEFFYRQTSGYRGFQGMCKACKRERRGTANSRRGRIANRTVILAMLALGRHPDDIAAHVGCDRRTVYRAAS